MQTGSSGFAFPKRARLLKSPDFREVLSNGVRTAGRLFSATYYLRPGETESRIGFAVGRAAGNAVVRNRLRRRVREAVRLHRDRLQAGWWIVLNPRRAALTAGFDELEREVERLFTRCSRP
ncbi:MAG: ribonuclease P protein component [Acidobacteriales bacterium]|nr:ribonuclease P protein component [Terriglobales bacterium]